jgi:hypothetical protein
VRPVAEAAAAAAISDAWNRLSAEERAQRVQALAAGLDGRSDADKAAHYKAIAAGLSRKPNRKKRRRHTEAEKAERNRKYKATLAANGTQPGRKFSGGRKPRGKKR